MDLEQLQKEMIALRHEKEIYDAQNRLFEIFINTARAHFDSKLLKETMQNALDIAAQFSGAEKGGLFLLDKNGTVTDSILTRNETNEEKRSDLIGQVIDKGLAGWVKKNLCSGLVTDTKTDTRWFTFPRAAVFSKICSGCTDSKESDAVWHYHSDAFSAITV